MVQRKRRIAYGEDGESLGLSENPMLVIRACQDVPLYKGDRGAIQCAGELSNAPQLLLTIKIMVNVIVRTMEGECDDLLIPLVNYFFREDYGADAKVERLRNEHFVERTDGSGDKRITDAYFMITQSGRSRRYHMECESGKYDGSVLVRIFEYTSQIALDGSVKEKTRLIVSFPYTGLLLLRGEESDTDEGEILIRMPGGEFTYSVPIVKMKDFSIDSIFEERLYFLIPFYIMRYEDRFDELEKDDIRREEFIFEYRGIIDRLGNEVTEGRLSTYSEGVIINLIGSIWYNISHKHKVLQEEAGEIMGGKILDLDWIRAHREWIAEGEIKGEIKGEDNKLISLICKKLSKGKDAKTIAEDLDEDINTVNEIIKAASPFDPENYDVDAIRIKWRGENKQEASGENIGEAITV